MHSEFASAPRLKVDSASAARTARLTLGELKQLLLTAPEDEIRPLLPGPSSDIIRCVVKLLSEEKLIAVGRVLPRACFLEFLNSKSCVNAWEARRRGFGEGLTKRDRCRSAIVVALKSAGQPFGRSRPSKLNHNWTVPIAKSLQISANNREPLQCFVSTQAFVRFFIQFTAPESRSSARILPVTSRWSRPIVMRDELLNGLNDEQRRAACHDDGPLLIIAGAGTGKTTTLVHRVAQLIVRGAHPSRILLLTFTRRAAAEMLRRVDQLLQRVHCDSSDVGPKPHVAGPVWGGTFHAVGTRLLRQYGRSLGLKDGFTIQDRPDSMDLLDVVRSELNLARTDKRFPKKATCLDICSQCVNTGQTVEATLASSFPWCEEHAEALKQLFRAYTERKGAANLLDYDDLLLYWHAALCDPKVASRIQQRFDCVLVDEYQDTNWLQSEIVRLLRPSGVGITAVGDDAQSIYAWRGATVRNILDFPQQFPNCTVIKLEQNYRSTQPILAATNAIIAQATERFRKDLWSASIGGSKPRLVTCTDDADEADFIVQQVLEQREAGIDLCRQAVLFRASPHSILLEAELARHNIPFVKYGGLKFIEAAHVKDLLALLRLAENPLDIVAGTRIVKLLPGVGPKKAQQLMHTLLEAGGELAVWLHARVPADASEHWRKLVSVLSDLTKMSDQELPAQVNLARGFYAPLCEERYDRAAARLADLEQLELLASRFRSRSTMLSDLTLDPPNSTQDLAGDPVLDEDYLVLSTIHSAKGLEWDAVYVIHAVDGNIPSDKATGSKEQLDEELRLFYVALTRAKRLLTVCVPLAYYHAARGPWTDRHSYAQRTRFIHKDLTPLFDCQATRGQAESSMAQENHAPSVASGVRQRLTSMWS